MNIIAHAAEVSSRLKADACFQGWNKAGLKIHISGIVIRYS